MEAETLGNTLSDAQALVDTVADSLAKVEAGTLGDTLSNAKALVETLADFRKYWSITLADSHAEVEAETLGYNLSDAQALVHRRAGVSASFSSCDSASVSTSPCASHPAC